MNALKRNSLKKSFKKIKLLVSLLNNNSTMLLQFNRHSVLHIERSVNNSDEIYHQYRN